MAPPAHALAWTPFWTSTRRSVSPRLNSSGAMNSTRLVSRLLGIGFSSWKLRERSATVYSSFSSWALKDSGSPRSLTTSSTKSISLVARAIHHELHSLRAGNYKLVGGGPQRLQEFQYVGFLWLWNHAVLHFA